MSVAKLSAIIAVEEAVICMTMLEGEGEIADYYIDEGVTDRYFYHQHLAAMWEWIALRRSENKSVSQLDYTADGQDADPSRTNAICNAVETWALYKDMGEKLREGYKTRALLRALQKAMGSINDASDSVDEVIDAFREEIDQLDNDDKGVIPASEFIPEARQEMIDAGEGTIGITTGFKDLDKIVDGMKVEDVVYIGARPGMGKTTLAMNIADHTSVALSKNTLIFSMEMTRVALGRRLIASRSMTRQASIRSRQQNFDVKARVDKATDELSSAPLWIHDKKAMTIRQIAAKCRSVKNKYGLDFVVIDYVSLIKPAKPTGSRREDVDEISRQIKELAGMLKLPILVIAQLNREYEKQGRKPRMSDFREAGGIEQDADIILALHQDRSPESEEDFELIVLKQREGPIGTIMLKFKKFWTRFIDPKDEQQPTQGIL